jgi:hypothetical protein
MRTTIRIESAPLVTVVIQVLRRGLTALKSESASSPPPFVQKTHDMGPPKFDVTKARWIAADLEDEEFMRKHMRGE